MPGEQDEQFIRDHSFNEQDEEDWREIKMLEKIANIRESQGIKNNEDEHSDFIKQSSELIDRTFKQGDSAQK